MITIYHQARGLDAWGRTEADEEAAPDGTVLAGTRSMSMRTMHKSEFLYFNHKQHSFLTGKNDTLKQTFTCTKSLIKLEK